MRHRRAARLALACVALALLAASAAGARASRGARPSAARVPQTFVLTDFGAVGDGETDDGPALQAALDALAEAGGGTLLVPAGRYAIVTPAAKDFTGLASSVTIVGIPSDTPPPPPGAAGQELTLGLDLTSEFLPRTGESAPALYVRGLRSFSVEELAFVGTPGVNNDAYATVYVDEVGEAAVRHCEFYGLSSLDGSIVLALRSSLKIERSVFLGCATSSGSYSSVVQNLEWKGVSVTDTVFVDYGQRPELFGKLDLGAPFAWVSLGNAAAVDNESPRREAVFRNVFFDEGGLGAIASTPDWYALESAPIDLVYVSTLRMNVSNLGTSGLYLKGLRGALVEDGRFGWSKNADAAVNLIGAGSAVLSRIECADEVTRIRADGATARLVAVDTTCPEVASLAASTRVFQAATDDDDPVRYVSARFRAALARDPDPAAHFYWADRILRCDADEACVTSERAALASYLAAKPQPTFTLEGRASDDDGQPLAGVAVALSGSQSVATVTDADGRYHFSGLPTSGVYTVAASKLHCTFARPRQTVTTPAGAQTVDFPAALDHHTISGRVSDEAARGIAGVTVTLSGGASATATTDADGYFAFASLAAGGAYTVTPSSSRHTFSPASQTFEDLGADASALFGTTPLFHTISGVLTDTNNHPVAGSKVALSGSKSDTATTNAQGFFAFPDVPRGGSYTVTPAPYFGNTFSPASRSFTNLTSDQGGTYVATPTSYKITGRVTLGGAAFAGVTVTLSGSQSATTTTDAGGNYSLAAPAYGDYTVTPSKKNYTFAAAAATFKSLGSGQTADFAATLNRYKITGRVTRPDGRAMSGVTVTLSGSQAQTAQTDAGGNYTLADLPGGGNYTVTPSKPNYDFAPAARSFNDLSGDESAPFVVTPTSYTVSGHVTSGGAALAGVTVTLSGSRGATATTDAGGAYSVTVASEGTYTVTPSKAHYTFAPQSATFTDPPSNKTADFAATLDRHKISGRVARPDGRAMPGVTVALSGSQAQTAQTDAGGNYDFASLPAGGDYTVTPSKAGYAFSPAPRTFNDLGADQAADFTVTPSNFNLAGRVTSGGSALAGVTVTLSGSRAATATTDAGGSYSFNVSSEGDYTVTPAKAHYTFAPKSLTFNNPVSDQAADFAAAVDRHTISGRVTNPGNQGLGGVTVTLSGSQAQTLKTDADGVYSFTNLAGGGGYTVTPSAPTLTFSPASKVFADLGADASANFVGTLVTYRLRGRVTEKGAGLGGVSVELSGAHPTLGQVGGRFLTAADGSYAFDVPAAGDYTVTPSKKDYTFDRPSATFAALTSDQTADFAATQHAVFEFAAPSYVVTEDDHAVVATVTRGGDTTTAAAVVYQALSGTARRGADFLASIGLLSFAPGETTKTFEVFITDDSYVEDYETFKLTLEPVGDALVGDAATASVTIRDNDATSALSNPIDDDEFFVRQHYRDFFSREPDAEGLKFWTDEIRRCGTDSACREVKRVNVSAAFFLSIEFQETGFLAYRAYKVAYGRVPERVAEFMLDARVIGGGVVVGRAGWQEALEVNKAAFVRDFVLRDEFAAAYPAAMTPAQFVAALFANAGVEPSAEDRQAALGEFGGAANTEDTAARARALRRVAENAALARAETNRAFVLMQYFGYLRRDPDELPDVNLDGYNHWLGKLVQFGGDWRAAEMVKAFLASTEYRQRFGN